MQNQNIEPGNLMKQFARLDPSRALMEAFISSTKPETLQVVGLPEEFLAASNTQLLGYAERKPHRVFDLSDLAKYNPNGILADTDADAWFWPDNKVKLLLTAREGEMSGLHINLLDFNEGDAERTLWSGIYVDIGWTPKRLRQSLPEISFRKRWESYGQGLKSPDVWFTQKVIHPFNEKQRAYYMPRGDFPPNRLVRVTSKSLENEAVKLTPVAQP